MHYEMHEPMHGMALGEALNSTFLVGPHPQGNIRSDADVWRSVALSGKDVDTRLPGHPRPLVPPSSDGLGKPRGVQPRLQRCPEDNGYHHHGAGHWRILKYI